MSGNARVQPGRDLRLLPSALAGWAGCALAVWLRPSMWWAVLGLGICGLAWWLSRRGRAPTRILIAPALVVSTLLCVIEWAEARREPPELIASAGSEVEVRVVLSQTVVPGARFVRANIIEVAGHAISPAPARVIGDVGQQRIPLGSETSLRGYLTPAKTHEQHAWVLLLRGQLGDTREPPAFLAGADRLREGFLASSLQRSGDAGELLPGLAIGDTSAVDDGLVHAMRQTALAHLVAVSGANAAVVVGLVVGLVRLLGGGVRIQMVAGVVSLVGFVVLVTPEPSILRASVMASVVLISLAWSRPIREIPVLAIAVLGLLAVNPWFATDFAFVLSVLATGGILVASVPLARVFSRVMPEKLAFALALPVAAQVACQPALILLNPVLSTWGVPANVLAAPAAPVATILGMAACLALPVAPVVGEALLWLAWIPSWYISTIGRTLADAPLSTIPWPPGWWGAIALATAGYCLIALVVWRPPRPRLAVAGLGGLAILALALVIAGFALPRAMTALSIPAQWSIAQCDVGQGDALVIRSHGKVVVIDVGRDQRKLSDCLSLLGVDSVEAVVITHFDDDHVGAWREVADRTSQMVVGAPVDPRKASFLEDFARAGLEVIEVSRGHVLHLGYYTLEVVWPESVATIAEGNDSSIVLLARASQECPRCVSGLFLGDIGEVPQQILSGRGGFGAVDVVKVSHHGSADQHHDLYRSLRPSVALIGVGADNTYGHPAPGILSVLEDISSVWRSDQRGVVTVHRDPRSGLVVWSER